MIDVVLTELELKQAADAGVIRQLRAIRDGRRDRHGFKGDPWEVHIVGAMGELAFAKAMDRYWTGAGQGFANDTDVGGVQVRWRSRDDYDLLVWESDPVDDIYVLVTGQPPAFSVRGWITGREAKRPEWFRSVTDRRPSFFVPQGALRPIEELLGRELVA